MISALKKRPVLTEAIAFGVFYFIYLLATTSVSYHSGVIFAEDAAQLIFASKMGFAGLGYLSFPLARRHFADEAQRRRLLVFSCAVAVLGAIGLTLFSNPLAFLAAAFLTMFALGHIGGFIYYSMSQVFIARRCPGRAVGISAAAATALHFLIQNTLYSDAIFIISVALGTAILFAFVVNPPRSWILSDPLPAQRDTSVDRREVLILIAITALLSLLFLANDNLALAVYSTMQEDGTSLGVVPLTALVGMLLAGFAADRWASRGLGLMLGCLLPVFAAATSLLMARQIVIASAAIMYFCGGVYVVFIVVLPMRLAARSAEPALWAGMGRVVRNFTAALAFLPMALLYRALGWWFLPLGGAILASLALLLLFLSDILEPEPVPPHKKFRAGIYCPLRSDRAGMGGLPALHTLRG